MKKLRRLKLSDLSKAEMGEKEQNVIRGGYGVCVCLCTACACQEIEGSGYFYNSWAIFDDKGGPDVEKRSYEKN